MRNVRYAAIRAAPFCVLSALLSTGDLWRDVHEDARLGARQAFAGMIWGSSRRQEWRHAAAKAAVLVVLRPSVQCWLPIRQERLRQP